MEKIFNKTFEEHTKELPAWFGPYLFYSSQCYRGLGFPFMERELLLISKKIMELYVNRFPNFGLEAFDLIDASLKQLMENQNFIITRLNIFFRLKFTNKVLHLAKSKIKIILETSYKHKFR